MFALVWTLVYRFVYVALAILTLDIDGGLPTSSFWQARFLEFVPFGRLAPIDLNEFRVK